MRAVRSAFPPGIGRPIAGPSGFVHTVGDREYWLVQTGVGLEKARQSAAQLIDGRPFSLMVSTGFACALVAADIGALLVGREVVYKTGSSGELSQVTAVPGDERDHVLAFVEPLVPPAH